MTAVFAGLQFRQTSGLFCVWIWAPVPWLQSAMPSRMPGTQVKNMHLDKATSRVEIGSRKRTPRVGPPQYARKTEGFPEAFPAPGVVSTLREVEQFLPDLEAKMIEFLAEWVVTLLSPATQIVKPRVMFVKEYFSGVLPRSQSYSLFEQRRILH